MSVAQADLAVLFGFLADETLTLDGLIEGYVNYHGSLYHGHQVLLMQRLRAAATILDAPAVAEYRDRDIVWPNGRISPGFLKQFAPGFAGAWYDAAPGADFTRSAILAASTNEWRSTSLPAPFDVRLSRAERPGVEVLFGEGRHLFISPYGYQRFDPDAGNFWPAASSRAFPRSIEGHRTVAPETPVAVIQDPFDGTNFAHFLYDCVPRILYLAELFPDFARRCLFLMGGEPAPFHALILRSICERHSLQSGQFVFPQGPEIWRLSSPTAFFSDQVEVPVHPLHMCHPRTLRMVRALLDTAVPPPDPIERIYISRSDASTRQVVNEPELTAALADRGYVTVRLSELDAVAQMGLLAGARHVVAPHGMGLANLVFNQRGGSLVEIFNPRMGTDAYAFVARALGLAYRFSVGADRGRDGLGTVVDVDHVMTLVAALDSGMPSGYKRSTKPAPGTADETTDAACPRSPVEVAPLMMSDTDLVQRFESLGENCEFGLVQRFAGAEPLGFFRFNYGHQAALLEMLDTEFREVDRAEDIELRRESEAADSELIVHNRRYGYSYHTFRHDADVAKVRAQQLRVVSFLRDKLVADLRTGEKIFVRKGERSVDEMDGLLRRLRRYGPATLLWVVPETETDRAGAVRVLQPGLLQGFLDRVAPITDAYDLSPVWLPVLRNAYALRVGGCAAGSVLTPPFERRTTNLIRQVHIGPRRANWWAATTGVVSDGSVGAPAGLHPESAVIEHRLNTDTVQATSALCGVAMADGLTPGAPYVVSMDVWIPEGSQLTQVGAVFNGLPATQVRIADLARRDAWQRVWVGARATQSEGRANPSLFAIGNAGARLYSTAWQLEIGHAPSAYASSRAGILSNRGPAPGNFRQRATV